MQQGRNHKENHTHRTVLSAWKANSQTTGPPIKGTQMQLTYKNRYVPSMEQNLVCDGA